MKQIKLRLNIHLTKEEIEKLSNLKGSKAEVATMLLKEALNEGESIHVDSKFK